MLTILAEVPRNQDDWDRFAFHNRVSHAMINDAMRAQGLGDLPESVLYPIDAADWGGWLQRHAFLHQDMDRFIGGQSADLSILNDKDEQDVADWINTHWLEHQTAESALGISS